MYDPSMRGPSVHGQGPTSVGGGLGEETRAPIAPIITLKGVTKNYGPGTNGLRKVELDVPQGSFLMLTGPSGSGKTTLLKLLYGAERANQGEIWVQSQNVGKLRGDALARFRRNIGVVFQDYKLIPNRTVTENIAFVLWAQGYSQPEIERRLPPALKLVGLQSKGHRFPEQLSGGEQQRVSIARAIAGTPPLLLADEPTGNLDPENSLQVLRVLNQLNRMGVTVIVTTHDELLVREARCAVMELQDGRLQWRRR
jgi:cell division transport system ATP-binding protein